MSSRFHNVRTGYSLLRPIAILVCPVQNEEGNYELEGEIEELALPTSLRESIRLRLATVEEADAELDLLLQLAAVLGGSFEASIVEPVWALLHEDESQDAASVSETVSEVIGAFSSHPLSFLY